MKILTENYRRTVAEANELFVWCVDTLGEPGADGRWMFGRFTTSHGRYCHSPAAIEYITFRDNEDATAFKLRWL